MRFVNYDVDPTRWHELAEDRHGVARDAADRPCAARLPLADAAGLTTHRAHQARACMHAGHHRGHRRLPPRGEAAAR